MSNPSHLNFSLSKVVQQKELKLERLYINRIYDVIRFSSLCVCVCGGGVVCVCVLNLKLSISFDRNELTRYVCLAEV